MRTRVRCLYLGKLVCGDDARQLAEFSQCRARCIGEVAQVTIFSREIIVSQAQLLIDVPLPYGSMKYTLALRILQ